MAGSGALKHAPRSVGVLRQPQVMLCYQASQTSVSYLWLGLYCGQVQKHKCLALWGLQVHREDIKRDCGTKGTAPGFQMRRATALTMPPRQHCRSGVPYRRCMKTKTPTRRMTPPATPSAMPTYLPTFSSGAESAWLLPDSCSNRRI